MNVEILMFSSPSCAGCKVMKPILAEIPNSRVVDVTEDHETAARFGIRGDLPVFVKLVDGEYENRLSGAISRNKLLRWASDK